MAIEDKQSESGSLNSTDYKKIAKGAALAFGGALLWSILVWAQASLSVGEFKWDVFGKTFLTVCVPAALSTGINALLKYFKGN